MSILARFANTRTIGEMAEMEKRTLTSSAFVPPPQVGVVDDYLGVHRAMACMTVLACVRVLADTIASLPWKAYKRDSQGVPKEIKPQPAILRNPFPGFDLYQWKWMVIASMALRGNSYHLITSRDRQGYPTSLLPLHPDIVFLERRPDIVMWFDPVYRVMGEAVPTKDMIHIRRFTMPGEPWGLSPIKQAAVAIGMSLGAEEYGYRYFKESANPSGLLMTDQDLDENAVKRQQKNWIASHGGRRLPAVLTSGFKWQNLSIKPEEAQFLECVAPDTLIDMADGTRIPARDVRVDDEVAAWNGSKLESARVAAVGKPPIKTLVRVTTARGRSLICTTDHPILGLRRLRTPGGRPLPTEGEWLPAGTLEVGQYVRVALGTLVEETQFSPLTAYFLGAMVGDGYIRRGSCAWSSGDAGVTERMSQAVESLGGSLQYRDRYDYDILTGGSGRRGSIIRALLNESGLVGSHAGDKFVPDIVTAAGPVAWRAFLSAYMDADGSVRDPAGRQKPAAYWSSASRELLEGCQHLLALLGINSAIYPGPHHGLYVMGAGDLSALAAQLDLAHPEKRRRLAGYLGATSRYRSVNAEYDRVTQVEQLGPGETVGIEIAGLHTHVTNGIISHNTRQFQRSEICLMYGVPPILIGDTKETTAWGTGVEQITLGAITFTFRAWTSCVESMVSSCLPGGQYVQFDYDALLRGDIEGRYNAYAKALGGATQTGWVSANEVRAREELDPIEGGDKLYIPNKVIPAGTPPGLFNPPPPPTPGGGAPGGGSHFPMPPIAGGEDDDDDAEPEEPAPRGAPRNGRSLLMRS
jgi:HK97 family phage portal protein